MAPPPYLISTDRSRIDFEIVHGFLATSYWSPGITRDAVEQAAANSLPFGLFCELGGDNSASQVGYARVLTDFVRFAYVLDVFVVAQNRGQGLGRWLMETMLGHPDLRGVSAWLLKTRDAHGLYERIGFGALADPELYMRRPGAQR
jgi:GNAT superfamily N-acetyltransferase